MDSALSFVSVTFAAIAGLFFASGLAVLTGGRN